MRAVHVLRAHMLGLEDGPVWDVNGERLDDSGAAGPSSAAAAPAAAAAASPPVVCLPADGSAGPSATPWMNPEAWLCGINGCPLKRDHAGPCPSTSRRRAAAPPRPSSHARRTSGVETPAGAGGRARQRPRRPRQRRRSRERRPRARLGLVKRDLRSCQSSVLRGSSKSPPTDQKPSRGRAATATAR